jgi:predicted nucleic acid-binding protein
MIIVCDTGPVHYLILIGCSELLPQMAERVVVPRGVIEELLYPSAPDAVRAWAAAPPDWLSIDDTTYPAVEGLGKGESAAISLAMQVGADLVLLDDKKARRTAESLGLVATGLLSVLEIASRHGWVDLADALDRLQHTTFRATPRLLRSVLDRGRR